MNLTGHFLQCVSSGGGQMAERLGNRTIDQKVAGSIPGRAKQITLCSWSKALHPTCLGENVPVLTVSHSG